MLIETEYLVEDVASRRRVVLTDKAPEQRSVTSGWFRIEVTLQPHVALETFGSLSGNPPSIEKQQVFSMEEET